MTEPIGEQLSGGGAERKDTMLEHLLGVVERTRRRRRMRMQAARGLVAAMAIAALCWVLWPTDAGSQQIADRFSESSPPSKVAPAESQIEGVETVPVCITAVVQTDSGILERYRPAPCRVVERIDDGELLRLLAALNRPTGMIRIGERVQLTDPVTDAELRLSQ